jgi:hypothetical protein
MMTSLWFPVQKNTAKQTDQTAVAAPIKSTVQEMRSCRRHPAPSKHNESTALAEAGRVRPIAANASELQDASTERRLVNITHSSAQPWPAVNGNADRFRRRQKGAASEE